MTLQGAGGGITIADGFKIDKTIFTSAELKAIFTGLQSLESVSDTIKYKKIIEKFSGNKDIIKADESSIVIDLSSHYKNSLSPKIETIQAAISNNFLISFDYFYNKGECSRLIEPYLILFKWSSWYLFGYCCEKQDFRMFKLNRLWHLAITNDTFKQRDIPSDKIQFEGFFTDEINLTVLFDETVKYRLIDEYGLGCFSNTDNNKLLFKSGFTNKENLFEWILSFGDKAEILEPMELRDEIRQIARNILKKYSEHDI